MVLIKTMNMPNSCAECEFLSWNEGRPFCLANRELITTDLADTEIYPLRKRSKHCPLVEIKDPSAMFITRRDGEQPAGIACAAVFEGSRVFMVEIQALTVPAKASLSRVYSEKIDGARVSRVAAVLEKRAGLRFSDQDIYVNVAGGIRLTESAIDAALAAALYSARSDIPLSNGTALVGELSLAGEIRPVSRVKQRVKTAKSLGYQKIIAPEKCDDAVFVQDIKGMVAAVFASGASGEKNGRKA